MRDKWFSRVISQPKNVKSNLYARFFRSRFARQSVLYLAIILSRNHNEKYLVILRHYSSIFIALPCKPFGFISKCWSSYYPAHSFVDLTAKKVKLRQVLLQAKFRCFPDLILKKYVCVPRTNIRLLIEAYSINICKYCTRNCCFSVIEEYIINAISNLVRSK